MCSVSIKEELRTQEKIDDDNGRTIIAMDVNHVVASNILMLDQNFSLIKSHLRHSSALGLDMFKGGAQRLVTHMTPWGTGAYTLEIDGKKFDGRFQRHTFELVFRARAHWGRYDIDNYNRVKQLYWELHSAPLVNIDGNVYARFIGNPSGQANTTPDNTFKNFMDFVVIWLLLVPKEYQTYSCFKKYTRMCICGDDINISVHPEFHQWFNRASIEGVAGQIGMDYEFAHSGFVPFAETTFLGHGFIKKTLPHFPEVTMYLPTIDCCKMRTSMYRYNEVRKPEMTIIRACNLRGETFACDSCKYWFDDLINYLRGREETSIYSKKPEIINAWKNYKTDAELWAHYSGIGWEDRQ